MLTTRAVVCDDFMLLPSSGVSESKQLTVGFEKTSAKVLTWPGVRGSNLEAILFDLGAGGKTKEAIEAKCLTFLYVIEGIGELRARPHLDTRGGNIGAQPAGEVVQPLGPHDGVSLVCDTSISLTNQGGVPLRILWFRNGFASPNQLRSSIGEKVILHVAEEDVPGTNSKPGDAKFTRHFVSMPAFEVARITVQPLEATSKLETHLRQHVFFVLGGDKGEFYLQERWRRTEPGDMVYTNAFTVHGFRSNECILELLLVNSLAG